MVFDFAAQPPELISAKIYSGPGAESLQAAAAAWDGLSSELQSTAANFQSVISGLISGDWTGPSSEAAAAAAAPYVSWLGTTAGQAEQTAGQARAAATAYETALAATVPPAEIAANRTQLLSLLQANIFGQYNAAIAALEAEYGQFWAQDVAAITVYSASSQSAAAGLGSFTEAPQTTNSSGQATQAAATTAASAAAAPSNLESVLEPAEATATNFLNQVTTLNGDFTKLVTNALGTVPAGPLWPRHGPTCTPSSPAPVARPPGPTWPTARPVWASLSGRTSSSTNRGATGSGWDALERPVGCPRRGTPRAWGHVRRARLSGSAHTIGKLSVPPSCTGATPRSGLRLRRCRTALLPRRLLPRWRFPLSALNQASLGSLAGGALGSPAFSRVVTSTACGPR